MYVSHLRAASSHCLILQQRVLLFFIMPDRTIPTNKRRRRERIYTKFRRISMQDISSDKLGPLLYVRIDWAKRSREGRERSFWSFYASLSGSIHSDNPRLDQLPRSRVLVHHHHVVPFLIFLVDFHPGMTIISNVMNDVLSFTFSLTYILKSITLRAFHQLNFQSRGGTQQHVNDRYIFPWPLCCRMSNPLKRYSQSLWLYIAFKVN